MMNGRSTIINRRPLRLYLGYCEIGVPPFLAWQYAGLSITGLRLLCWQCCQYRTTRPDGVCSACRNAKKHQRQSTRTGWVERAIRLRKNGMTCAEIGRIVNRSLSTVSRATSRTVTKPWIPQPWMLDAADDYRAGKTLEEIGQKNGRARERIRQILKQLGVPAISQEQRRAMLGKVTWAEREKERRKQIANYRKQQRFLLRVKAERLYLSGLSMARVAVEIGLKHACQVQVLMGPAVKRRPAGRWTKEHQEKVQRSRGVRTTRRSK